MPRLALQLLHRRLERSHLLNELAADARILFRKRLRFHPEGEKLGADPFTVELLVGAVSIGRLSLTPPPRKLEQPAYLRWLKLVGQDLAEHLSSPHGHAREVLPARIAEAANIIRERHQEPLSLAAVASGVGISRERLSRLFHETLGITFSAYLNHARLETARKLLRQTKKPVTEIAFISGFQSLSQFHRRFKSAESKSPSAYREGA
ncbi:helix-turn-helix transcriptional regulator [Pelagicoccus sp. SDUM812002]|uniref:helix-turn-helix transcriptional regulator n=1 Tax=Pelagicoccus sp. SDUM812002 TaxID=3041266 RepID=UPI00280C97A3|nr:helix-turn-helix transcriptional regulator [Pelagicoccus sp. SDUM812002]MDQ8187196.1 helix-turn-helix transcriptional regulator [Pelagicoccus sp. SDUM812002]